MITIDGSPVSIPANKEAAAKIAANEAAKSTVHSTHVTTSQIA
jgi:hypothetical protein